MTCLNFLRFLIRIVLRLLASFIDLPSWGLRGLAGQCSVFGYLHWPNFGGIVSF